MKHLIVVGGATGSGKTEAAIRLAEYFGTEIISSDSRQFYREMTIGTAKPTPTELARAQHHFIDSLSIHDNYTAGDFERDGLALLEVLYKKHDVVVVAGGSGLFVSALCEGLDVFPEIPQEVRARVDNGWETGGIEWLQAQVAEHDPDYFEKVDKANYMRLRRALEVCLGTGMPYSAYTKGEKQPRPFTLHQVVTDWPREVLYHRIDQRVDLMVTEGLEAEARVLLPFRHLNALRTVGYEEWFEHFDGMYDRATAIEKIKQHSRNYAKRQMTWFRKHGDWKPFNPSETEKLVEYLLGRIG
jgi:tRNA dimethylallyltransferase